MRVIEVREDNPWPKWTEATQVVEGTQTGVRAPCPGET